jgi:hypothetical protein
MLAAGDTCDAIYAEFGVPPELLYYGDGTKADCTSLAAGRAVCLTERVSDGGQLPAGCTSGYRTAAGDTCYSVANGFSVPSAEFLQLNPAAGCPNPPAGTLLCVSSLPGEQCRHALAA